MSAIDGLSENDLWVATSSGDILRGDGRNWHKVQALRTTAGIDVEVREISVRDNNDVWVVGDFQLHSHPPGSFKAAAEPWSSAVFHWDSTSFKQIIVPGLEDQTGTRVESVATANADDAWLVGSSGHIWHWDGNDVVVVEPTDREIKGFDLYDISAISGNDIWAVGTSAGQAYGRVIVAHWDGNEWNTAPSWDNNDIEQQGSSGALWDIVALSDEDVWATGQSDAVHWNGHQWIVSQKPSFEGYGNVLFKSLTASAPDDVWAVGYAWTDNPRPFAMRWDGMKWSIVTTPKFLNLGSFEAAKAFPDKLWVTGTAYQDEDFGPVYSTSAEFVSTSCK